MNKLLLANLHRLCINKPFWFTVIFMMFAEIIICFLLLGQSMTLPMEFLWFMTIPGIGILTSIFISTFLGTEYNDGTIRNKLIVGHKRTSIYLSSFITGIIAVTIIDLVGIVVGFIFGVISFAPISHSIGQIVSAGVITWFASVSYIAIFHFVGMLSASKTRTAIISMLIAFILIFIGLVFYALLSGAQNAVYQFMFEYNPFGQTIQAMSINIEKPWKLIGYSSSLSVIFTSLGLYIFQKKDLK